jgi:hypothetical protein
MRASGVLVPSQVAHSRLIDWTGTDITRMGMPVAKIAEAFVDLPSGINGLRPGTKGKLVGRVPSAHRGDDNGSHYPRTAPPDIDTEQDAARLIRMRRIGRGSNIGSCLFA